MFNVTLHVTIRDIGFCSPNYVTYFSHLRVQVAFVWEVWQCNSAYAHLFWQPLLDTHWTYLCYMRAFPFLLASDIWKPGTEDTEFLANAPQWYAYTSATRVARATLESQPRDSRGWRGTWPSGNAFHSLKCFFYLFSALSNILFSKSEQNLTCMFKLWLKPAICKCHREQFSSVFFVRAVT